jgi:hypothetical protein
MPTTGRTSEENLTYMSMRKNSVPLGKLRTSFRLMLMVANKNTDAPIPMDGKSKSTTLKIIKCMLVDSKTLVLNLTVLITTLIKTSECL